jgi:uncharacterized protein YndB with AHSA1/START domain
MTETNDVPELSEQRMVLTRVFDAPRPVLWKAWTDPQTLAKWWGPNGFEAQLDTIVLEPRVGGKFKLKIFSAEHGIEVPIDVVYLEVVENELLKYTEPVPCIPVIASVTGIVTFKTVEGDKTELNFDVTMETTEEIRNLSEEGWTESFDKLDALLAAS